MATPSKANYETALSDCQDAVAAGNWALAWTKYCEAEIQLAGLEIRSGAQGEFYEIRRDLEKIGVAIQRAKAGAAASAGTSGFIRTKMKFQS